MAIFFLPLAIDLKFALVFYSSWYIELVPLGKSCCSTLL